MIRPSIRFGESEECRDIDDFEQLATVVEESKVATWGERDGSYPDIIHYPVHVLSIQAKDFVTHFEGEPFHGPFTNRVMGRKVSPFEQGSPSPL